MKIQKKMILWGILLGMALSFGYGVNGVGVSRLITENPGLANPDGSIHRAPSPHLSTGKTISVTDYGADPSDGSDARAAIEQAITAAKPGDEVYFPDGVYHLNSSWSSDPNTNIRLKSGVNLRGQSQNGVILITSFNDSGAIGSSSFNVIRGNAIQNVIISKLTVTSTWNGKYTTETAANNPDAGGPTRGIAIGNSRHTPLTHASSNIIVENVTVEKFRRAGIVIGYGCHDIVLKNCTVRNATDLGGSGAGYGFVIQGAGHRTADSNLYLGTIKDTYWNVITGCKSVGPYIRHAALIQYWAHHNLVTDCVFSGTQLDAIDLHGEDEYSNEISHNTVTGVTNGAGIGVGNSGATHDKSGPSNFIHDNTIRASKRGITVCFGSDGQRVVGNLICDNTMISNGYGIGLGKTSRTIVRSNRITGNTAPGFYAIYLFHDKTENDEPAGEPVCCTIIGNRLSRNSSDQIIRGPGVSKEAWQRNKME